MLSVVEENQFITNVKTPEYLNFNIKRPFLLTKILILFCYLYRKKEDQTPARITKSFKINCQINLVKTFKKVFTKFIWQFECSAYSRAALID